MDKPDWVVTSHQCPPIPVLPFWIAWDDRLGADCSPYGYGRTEQESIDDLTEQLED